jgi:uncharacterized membrane protein HdeD (DUF308 family)
MSTLSAPANAVAKKLGRLWWVFVVIGVAWIIVGFVVLRFDRATVTVVAIVFGVLILLAAASEVFRAIVTPNGWRIWHISFAILLAAAGVLAFANTGTITTSAIILVTYVAVSAGFRGIADISAAFAARAAVQPTT